MDDRRVPSPKSLRVGLSAVLAPHLPSAHLRIIRREASVFESTFPSEVVTCQFADGAERKFYLKYHCDDQWDSFGHRGGVAYEGIVYRDVLSRLTLPAVKCYGSYVDPATGRPWLVLEYLEDALRADLSDLPLSAAAHWIGHFHRQTGDWLARGETPVPRRYDREYYMGWVSLGVEQAERMPSHYPWLAPLCRCFEEAVEVLTTAEQVIIHGEYYPNNILITRDTIYPVDWESAAVAVGEIDLAMITEDWPDDEVKKCEVTYIRSRWPEGEPPDFARRLGLARLYMHFRWLGDETETSLGGVDERIETLRLNAVSLGMIRET